METPRQELMRAVGLTEGMEPIDVLMAVERWAENEAITVVYYMIARLGAQVYEEK